MKGIFQYISSIVVVVLALGACNDNNNDDVINDDFNRQTMLAFWADQIIIPGFDAYVADLETLSEAADDFIESPDQAQLDNLRNTWLQAYKSWQYVSMFDIGKAEEIGLRNFTNIYPTDVALVQSNAEQGGYNLELPSNFDAQGFPALDFLLYGIGATDQEIITILSGDGYSMYLDDLVSRLEALGTQVRDDWTGGYRDDFVNNDGSSATASTDKLTNDFLFYYEKFLRAAKIGIPAGVFSGSELSTNVEAPYSEVFSKELFFEGFDAVIDFFQGVSYDGSARGECLESYITHVATANNLDDVGPDILAQWDSAYEAAEELMPSFKAQVETDNVKMLEVYDELQKAVVLLKVDMFNILNIQVDFVDADGD